MKTLQKAMIAATIAAAAGTAIFEGCRAAHLQDQLLAQQEQQTPLAEQARQLGLERDDATNRLAAAQQENERLQRELAELPKLRGEVSRLRAENHQLTHSLIADTNDLTESAARAWHARVEQLRQHLEQNPQAGIAEFKFLTEKDWLSAVPDELKTEVDYRRAMSRLRTAGETHFVNSLLQPALKRYVEANNGQFPSSLGQLQPFVQSPEDEAILQRYEIVPHEKVPDAHWGGDWVVTQKGPVDKAFDGRLVVGATGGWGRIRF